MILLSGEAGIGKSRLAAEVKIQAGIGPEGLRRGQLLRIELGLQSGLGLLEGGHAALNSGQGQF